MNKARLKSVMVLHGDTNVTLSEYLNLSEQSLCNKMNENGTEFKQGEIRAIKRRYNLTSEEVDAIFFVD